ncbi:MAG: TolC family protein [Oligoflexia bacterium]|nr:TolC family protein [Oligoflexia bacterium]
MRLSALVTVLGLALTPAFAAEGAPLSFAAVWQAVQAESPSQKAATAGYQAAEIASDRSGRHWLPRAFLNARAYETNDPAQTFFALLGERQATSNDFVPDVLNHPGSSFFTQAGVGLDFPIFEGGAKVAEHDALKSAAHARSLSLQAAVVEDYLTLTRLYGGLLIMSEQEHQLRALERTVESTLQRYQLGERGNPVGYSGLLGLKGLRNRVQAAILQNLEQVGAFRDSLFAMAKRLPEGWSVKPQEFTAFLSETLPAPKSESRQPSASVQSAQAMAESQAKAAEGERAKFLPKLGLSASEDLTNGSRGTGTSYSAGAYLQWNLFSATDYGSVREAQFKSAEANGNAEAQALGERMRQSEARHADFASTQTIQLLNENVKLLTEQTEASRKLYQSGAISALQFLEVLSRRADLLASLTQAELELLAARETELKTSDFEVP